jgi:hypothetical protein
METTILKIKIYGWIIYTLLLLMFFPFGIYLILQGGNYIYLAIYLFGYILSFFCLKNGIHKVDSIEIKIG